MRALWKLIGLTSGLALIACGDDESGNETRDAAMAAEPDASHSHGDPEPQAPVEVDRSQYKDVGTDAPLDYADLGMWACHPGLANNECHANLDATEIKPDGSQSVVKHERAAEPAFDCFYVYPTVLLTGEPNMVDFSSTGLDLVADPLLSQAARFNRMCEIYAPLYRQVGLSGTMIAEGADWELGFNDVRDAFAYYLEHDNKGRPFVLIGHSQGSFMLTTLIQMDVDEVDDVRERMLSAVMLGGRAEVKSGQDTGGSFKNIPICKAPGDTGCVIGYVSYADDKVPGDDARFGVAATEGNEVICTNPALLAGNDGPLAGSYYPLMLNNASFRSEANIPEGIETPFLLYREVLSGACRSTDTASYFEVSTELASDDPRLPPYRSVIEDIGWGLHLTDFNNALEDLLEAVALQAKSAGLD